MKKYDRQTIKTALDMAIPAIVESFFVAFVGLIDSFMVSALGSDMVAAVGLTTQPKFVGYSIFMAINVAVAALVARRVGQKKRAEANTILSTVLVLVPILAVIMSCCCVFFAPKIMELCGSTSQTHDSAVIYFRIIMGGMIFNCMQMSINSALRGAGNTKITMRTNIVSSLVNVVFNFLLIEGRFGFPALGIAGAAIATVLGAVSACCMSIVSIFNTRMFINIRFIVKEKIYPRLRVLKDMVTLSYGIFFEQLLMRIGFVATAIMAAKLGTDVMAAHQVGMNTMGLTFSFGDGLQAAAVALIGRSLGENNPEKAKEYGGACRAIGVVISVCVALIYLFGSRWMMGMFFSEEAIVDIGVSIMYVAVVIAIFQIQQVIYMGCLRGAGDTLYTAIIVMVSATVVRTVVSYVCGFVLGWGIVGVWLGVLGDQVSRFIFSSLRFKAGKWVQIKI